MGGGENETHLQHSCCVNPSYSLQTCEISIPVMEIKAIVVAKLLDRVGMGYKFKEGGKLTQQNEDQFKE